MFVRKELLLGVGALVGTAGGLGIYSMMSPDTFSKKDHKHKEIFEKLSKTYSGRTFKGTGRDIKIEVVDPNDHPWWNKKWRDYKGQNLVAPKTGQKESLESLEGFQDACYLEIRRLGPDVSQTAKYSTNKGDLEASVISSGFLGNDELKDRKFFWEFCLRTSITEN